MSDLTGFSIIYDHEGIVVVNKNFGTPSQPNKKQDPDVYTQLCAHYDHIGQHHRLDQTASGLLLFSTNPMLNPALSRAFKEHKIARSYWIWVIGTPSATGTWSQPLDGKKARSHYHVLSSDGMTAHLNVTLETGRTHQIRRHAQLNGHPILGDHRYGGTSKHLWPRLCLHAHTLQFQHPRTMETVTVQAPLPSDLHGLDNLF